MKRILITIGVLFLASFVGGSALLLAHGATPSEAITFMASAGYSFGSFEISRPLGMVCAGAGLVAGLCLWAGLCCVAVYGLTRVVRLAWTAKPRTREGG